MSKKTKPWNIAATGEDSGEIVLYGDVLDETPRDILGEEIDGDYITPDGFREDLEAVKDKSDITIKINSCGGDLYTGIAIHNAIKALDGHKTVIVEGIAASAASVIAMAGDTIQMFPGSLMMIHGVAGFLYDFYTLDDLKKMVKSFDASERAIAAIYDARTGLGVDKLRGMMSRETWMTGEEAVENGFADEVIDADPVKMSASADRSMLLVAGVHHDVRGLNLPDAIPTNKRIHPANFAGENIKPTETGGEEVKDMTLDEFKKQNPDAVKELEDAAVKAKADELANQAAEKIKDAADKAVQAERERMKAIDEIADAIGDSDLINDAKYNNPVDAKELAFNAMLKQKAIGAKVLDNAIEDAKETEKVNAEPGKPVDADPVDPMDKILAEIANSKKEAK